MKSETFYAIYCPDSKKFKSRGNSTGVSWTDNPVQTYETKGRAEGAIKSHMKISLYNKEKNLIVVPVLCSW